MKTLRNIAARLIALIAAASALSSCDKMIYDYEGDCDPHYKARFIFDYNMLYADAFPQQVSAVTLYLIDPATGAIVWQKSESGDILRTEGYLMDIDVAPGEYNLIAWCGEGIGPHFTVPADATHHSHLTCTLGRERDADGASACVRHDIGRLYHGAIRNTDGTLAPQTFPDDEGTYIYTVPLIKDTNDVNIVLQHLSGETVNKDDFTFTITTDNGTMDWDNTLIADEPITYYAHHKTSGTATTDPADAGRALTSLSACISEHTIARLVKGNDTRLRIHNRRGECIVDIPLIDYALLVKGNHNRTMTDQEYLDRQDKYDLVFFLDQRDHWMNAYIYINSWKIVLQNTGL